jgi:hypothetical protein
MKKCQPDMQSDYVKIPIQTNTLSIMRAREMGIAQRKHLLNTRPARSRGHELIRHWHIVVCNLC